jgi:hypothetical protein
MSDGRDRAWRILDIILSAAVTLQMAINVKLLQDVAAMKGNRFTSQDGLEVWKEIALIKEDIAGIPDEIPPTWFLSEVKAIEEKLDKIDDKMTEHLVNHNELP